MNWNMSQNSTTSSSNDKAIESVFSTKFDSFFLFLIFITNGFLVGKIITDKRLQTSINFLLMIHNILNILLCLLTLLPAAVVLTTRTTSVHPSLCHIGASGYLLVNYLSITNLASIAVDRWRTIASSKYTLFVKQIIIAQIIHILTAFVFALPWTIWLNKNNSVVEFSPGFLKCRVVHRFGTQRNGIVSFLVLIRYLVFMIVPVIVISYCFLKIFNKVKGRWNSVGPVVHAPDGIPVGYYLKSAYTNALLISGFIILRFPELIYIAADTASTDTESLYAQRFVAYITWIETVLFPFICIMRNTTLLRRVTSLACCNLIISVLSSKTEKRKKQYQVEQATAIDRWISSPSQESNETAITTVLSGSISTIRSSSPAWSRVSPAGAWTKNKPITVF